jgi:uncharacterized protein
MIDYFTWLWGNPLNILDFTLFIWIGSCMAGFLGALTGLGGGVVIVPMLTLLFGVDIRYAVGASLVSVIATSSGAAAAYVREGFSNIRVGMFLEIATTLGALTGAWLSTRISTGSVSLVFGITLLFSSVLSAKENQISMEKNSPPDFLASHLKMNSYYPEDGKLKKYSVYHVPWGTVLMYIAGTLSALLGIGSGAVKVLAMDRIMRLPFKVSTTTSNFMIGVTAAAGSGVYLNQGYIDPGLAMPIILGVLPGSMLGARILSCTKTKFLKLFFGVIIFILGVEMIFKGFSAGF